MLPPPTVILADDHPMLLEGLRKLLEPDLDVVAVVSDGLALVEAAARLRPALAVVDISMEGVDGLEATRRLVEASPATRVVILSFHGEASWVRAAFDAGAWGYLTKAAAGEEIERALREVVGGRYYVSPAVTRELVGSMASTTTAAPTDAGTRSERAEGLTARELDVLRWVGLGSSNKEIARELGISVSTVRTHLSSVYEKLGRESRVELALYAAQRAAED